MNRTFAVLSFFLLLIAACSKREAPEFFDFEHKYSLRLYEVRVLDSEGVNAALEVKSIDCGGQVLDDRLEVCVAHRQPALFAKFRNQTDETITLPFNEATYTDEEGTVHQVGHSSIGGDGGAYRGSDIRHSKEARLPLSISPRGTAVQSIFLPNKIYMVQAEPLIDVMFHEPLIPGSLRGESAMEMEKRVDRIAAAKLPVRLKLPVQVKGSRYEYTLAFLLQKRWPTQESAK